ncbi:MAG: radical SAM protein [Candidatus Altiarchaeota archaeon]
MAKNQDKIKIEIVTGFSCNNNCKFCSVVCNNSIDKPFYVIKKEIAEAVKEKPYELNFTGGEPTIRRDIFKILEYAKDKIDNLGITTNGRMFSYENFTKRMVDSGLNGAIFSIHSHKPEVHDYLTQVKGSYEQAIAGLKNLSEYSRNININTVLTTENYENLPEMTEFLINKFNINYFCLIFPSIDGNLLKNIYLIPKYSEVSKKVIEALKVAESNGIGISALNIPPCFLPKYESRSSMQKLNTKMFWFNAKTDLDIKKSEGKIKTKNCDKCKLKDTCPGISVDYLNIYGDEEFHLV